MKADAVELDWDVIGEFLTIPSERPLGGIVRCLVTGICVGVFLLLNTGITAVTPWSRIAGLIITGWGVTFLGWGAERLWYSTIGRMFLHPLTLDAYLTRLPFWFIGGGVGYTMGLLISKKAGLLSVHDIPVKSLFIFGGYFGLILQAVSQIRIYRFIRHYHPTEHSEIERSHNDKN
jgi:hypothetical protein